MDRSDIRRTNLSRLLAGTTLAAAAKRIDTTPNYLTQLLGAYKTQSGRQRAIGNQLASRIEKAFDKPAGWLDTPHEQHNTSHLTESERTLIEAWRTADDRLRKTILAVIAAARTK